MNRLAYYVVLFCSLTANLTHSSHLSTILYDRQSRKELAAFIDNVMQQMPSDKFFNLVDSLSKEERESHKILYRTLLSNVDTHKPLVPYYHQLKALGKQKTLLANQARQLIGNRDRCVGCMEIGSPGVYAASIKRFVPIEGTIYAMTDKERLSDHAQGFRLNPSNNFLPYDQYVPLNDYAPIDAKVVPNGSLDLIICFIGLHHIPQEKVEPFINSLFCKLRPGGVLLLREHDVTNAHLNSLVHAAHSVFNCVIGATPLAEEMNEYRDFHDLSYWTKKLKAQGFIIGTERILQEGDPTLNTMIQCVKPLGAKIETIDALADQTTTLEKEHIKELIQTYLSSPEWVNVDVSQEYGDFINHTPFYEFPYFKSIGSYWDVFLKSWKTAAQKKGTLPVLSSPYTLMNLFIGISMTVEYTAKGVISAPLSWLYSGQEDTIIRVLVNDPEHELDQLDARIKILNRDAKTNTCIAEFPRYKQFLEVVNKISKTKITVLDVAGQKVIQCKVRCQKSKLASLSSIAGCKLEYNWSLPTKPNHSYAALTVDITRLTQVIKQLDSQQIELLYFHDF